MTKQMKTIELIELIRRGGSIEGIVLSDLETQTLGFREAVLLAENGFVVPSGNIVYNDSEIAYDPAQDETEWEGDYQNLQTFLAEKDLSAESSSDYQPDNISVRITSDSSEMKNWLNKNAEKLQLVVNKLVRDLYKTEQLLNSED